MATSATHRRPRDRKAQLAGAAAARFADAGYHRAGIDDVAAAVGITGGAVYRHFATKYELLRRAVFDGMDLVDAAATRPSGLGDLLNRLATLSLERRDLGVLLQRESRHLEPDDQAALRQRVTVIKHRLGELLPELDADDAALTVRSLFAVLASPSYHRVADADDQAVLTRMLAVIVDFRNHSTFDELWSPKGLKSSKVEWASRREALLSVAVQLFARRGYAAVRMEDVGAAAGIAGPSIYQHFESKADLLTAALTRGAEWLQFGLSRALAAADSESRALELVVDAYVEFVLEQTDLVSLLLTETINLADAQQHTLRRLQHDYVAEWVRLVRAVRPEVSEPQARFLTQGVLGIVNDNARSGRARGRADLRAVLTELSMEVLHA